MTELHLHQKWKNHLSNHGVVCKPVEKEARVLGMWVFGEQNCLYWKRDNDIGETSEKLTRRVVFSVCGRLTSHLPVCSWLRVAASYLKRRANTVTNSWDDEITDPLLRMVLAETLQRVKRCDPARGRWDVTGDEAVVWVDASSLAIAAALEMEGNIIEDVCWLRQDECLHISLSELEAVLRGINLGLAWNMKQLTLTTDSKTVYHWLMDALSGASPLKTKAPSKMLIRRRLDIIKSVIREYEMQIEVKFVSSAENKADASTRVPNKWLSSGIQVCGAVDVVPEQEIRNIHQTSGHPGIKRTLYFCKRLFPATTRRQVQHVVRNCDACQSIDPAPANWEKGTLGVASCWERVSMDICHVQDQHYLTLIDCGPSRYAVWRRLRPKTV